MTRSVIRLTFLLLITAAVIHTDPVPKVTLRARVEGPPGQSVPRELAVRVRPSLELVGQEERAWETTVSCPVRDGEWTCAIPAGRVDLRITGAAIQPIYRWGVNTGRGGTADLGTLRLWRGGSITGSVRPDGKIPQYSLRVDLLPLDVGGPSAGEAGKPLRSATLESTSRPWGFFHFEGIPPGRYIVRVQDPGLPTLYSNRIVFEGDRPVEIPPFILKRLSFSVEVTPPKDPYGRSWKVMLSTWPLAPGEPFRPREVWTDSGLAKFPDLAPGHYSFSVLSEAGSRQVSWFGKEIQLDSPSLTAKVNLPRVRLKGRVLYQDRPLRSTVALRGESSTFTFPTDEGGEFDGYVKDEGSWTVLVSAQDPRVGVILQDPVKVPKGMGRATVEIRVPDTSLTAEVVDAQGRRAAKAVIQVIDEVKNLRFQDDQRPSDPVQQIIGLKPGLQRIRAAQQHPLRLGDPVEVRLREGERGPHLRLRLPETITVRGRVLPRFGYATGARVFAWPSGTSNGAGVEADEDGDFEFSLPGGTRKVQLVVLPAGNALRILESAVSENRPLEIPVHRAGGTLILEGPEALVEIPPQPKDDEPLNRPLPVLLRQWADLQGTPQSSGRLVVPNVEPGAYTLCPGSPFTLRPGGAKEGEKGCASGVLKAAGELRLRLPESRE